jgi:hypothetical protein
LLCAETCGSRLFSIINEYGSLVNSTKVISRYQEVPIYIAIRNMTKTEPVWDSDQLALSSFGLKLVQSALPRTKFGTTVIYTFNSSSGVEFN